MGKTTMYNSEFCKVSYLDQHNAVLCEWKQACSYEAYRKPLLYGLSLLNEYKATTWITDTRHGFDNIDEDTDWLLSEFTPQAIKSSCENIYFIISENSPLKDEIDLQTAALSLHFNVTQIPSLDHI